MSVAINFIKMDSPVKGVLRRIIFRSKGCTVPYALLEAKEDQDRKVLRDRLYRSVCNRVPLCLHRFAVSEIWLLHRLMKCGPFSSITSILLPRP